MAFKTFTPPVPAPPISMSGKTPTAEQAAIMDAVAAIVASPAPGRALKIIAYAGAGKTSTLFLLASGPLSDQTGRYLAFNRDIVAAAKSSMPPNVDCSTIHSIACRATGVHPGKFKNINTFLIRSLIATSGFLEPEDAGAPVISQANWLAAGLRHFCLSDDPSPCAAQVDYVIDVVIGQLRDNVTDADAIDRHKRSVASARLLLKRYLAPLWNKILADKSLWTYEIIVKVFAESPELIATAFSGCDFLLLDEAQDLNPIYRKLAVEVSKTDCLLIAVGDPYQSIYSWNLCVNALSSIQGETYYLTQSFRFGPALANLATSILLTKPEDSIRRPVRGNANKATEIVYTDTADFTNIDAIVCRTNKGIIAAAISAAEQGLRIYIPKISELVSSVKSADALFHGRDRKEITDPLFRNYATWQDAKDHSTATGEPAADFMTEIETGELQKKIAKIRTACSSDEAGCDLTFTTTHKAKGLEWPVVMLWCDFASNGNRLLRYYVTRNNPRANILALEEWHIKYVASTRAINRLIVYSGADQVTA